jgi:hypothetical protein
VFDDSRAAPSRPKFWILLGLIALLFVAQAVHLARVLVPSHDETSALFLGYLAASGRVSLYQDEVVGHRPPGPAYIFGATQLLWGRSLMAARLTSVAFALTLLLLTAWLGRTVGGDATGLLAAAFLTAQGAIVGYYAIGDYHALVPMMMMAGLLVWLSGAATVFNVLGAAVLGSLFFMRIHTWPLLPAVLLLALRRGQGWLERALVVLVMTVPPLIFLSWDVRHLKLFVPLPVVEWLVRPLGYMSFTLLDMRPYQPWAWQGRMLLQLARRYEFLILATVVIVLLVLWRRWRGGRGAPVFADRRVALLAGLFVYTLACFFVALRINFKWIGLYFASLVPLLAVVLGYLSSRLLADAVLGPRGRAAFAVFLATVLVLPIYYNRNPLIPFGAMRAADPVRAVQVAGRHLARLVPADARVFFFGQVDVFYFSGLPPTYLQQISNYDTLAVNDENNAVTLRSGYYGMPQVEQWLGAEADYAVVSPEGLHTFAEAFHNHPDVNRPKVARMRELLDRYFTRVGTVSEYPYYSYDVYRRVERPASASAPR